MGVTLAMSDVATIFFFNYLSPYKYINILYIKKNFSYYEKMYKRMIYSFIGDLNNLFFIFFS